MGFLREDYEQGKDVHAAMRIWEAIYTKETQGLHLYESCKLRVTAIDQYQPSRISCFMRKIMSGSDHSSSFDQLRLMVKKVLAKPQREGEGVVVRRSIGKSELKKPGSFSHVG